MEKIADLTGVRLTVLDSLHTKEQAGCSKTAASLRKIRVGKDASATGMKLIQEFGESSEGMD